MAFNGPERELADHPDAPGSAGDLEAEMVYCVRCGAIFVWNPGRDCPACTLAELIESVGDRVERLERRAHTREREAP